MRIIGRLEFKIQDCWIGVFWKRAQSRWCQDEDQSYNTIFRVRICERLHLWFCLLPCVPLHIIAEWGERLMSEDETLADMATLGEDE